MDHLKELKGRLTWQFNKPGVTPRWRWEVAESRRTANGDWCLSPGGVFKCYGSGWFNQVLFCLTMFNLFNTSHESGVQGCRSGVSETAMWHDNCTMFFTFVTFAKPMMSLRFIVGHSWYMLVHPQSDHRQTCFKPLESSPIKWPLVAQKMVWQT